MRQLALQSLGCLAGALSQSFYRAVRDPERAQRRVEARLAADLGRAALGRHDGLGRGADRLSDVPPRTWEQLAPWVDRQLAGERALTCHRVLFDEATSGSSGAPKRVPYTAPLREAFTHLFLIWVHDLLRHGPPLRTGTLFMSLSPQVGAAEVSRTDDDTAFLDGWARSLLRPFLAVPPSLALERDAAVFRERLILALLHCAQVEVFSVWNPSLLSVLLDTIVSERTRYAQVLHGARRAALLEDPPRWTGVWPELKLVSCWRDAHAARLADRIEQRLPGVLVQGKGLLATEGPVTVPILGAPAPVPLLDRVLVELIDLGGRVLPLHEASDGATYELLLSQPGGLPRYRIGDRVQVHGFYHATPCLQFVGRGGQVSDLVGEKLHEAVVVDALAALAPGAAFCVLVPLREPMDRYALLLDEAPHEPAQLAAALDQHLRAQHHYRLARELGQLGAVEVIVDPRLPDRYLHALARGARLGDVKPRALLSEPADRWVWAEPD